jgi:hypothetical protein
MDLLPASVIPIGTRTDWTGGTPANNTSTMNKWRKWSFMKVKRLEPVWHDWNDDQFLRSLNYASFNGIAN